MATQDGPPGAGLIHRVLDASCEFSFFQLVSLLERASPDAARVGNAGPPSREAIRFRPSLSLAFPTSDVARVEAITGDGQQPRYLIETTFLGLYGTTSPMPSHLTEDLLQEVFPDSLVRRVLDLFHHRLLSLFYRCWEKYRYDIQYQDLAVDPYSRRMLSLAGLNVPGAERQGPVPLYRFLRYSGLITQRPCSSSSLAAALSDFFENIATAVVPWVLRWVRIPADLQNHLGSAQTTLGRDMHLGEMVRDRAGKFRIVMGPVRLAEFLLMLPGEAGFGALAEIVRLLVIDQLAFEIELILRREEIPELVLSTESTGARLGQTSWLGRPPGDERITFQVPRNSRRDVQGQASGHQPRGA